MNVKFYFNRKVCNQRSNDLMTSKLTLQGWDLEDNLRRHNNLSKL